MRSVRNGRTGGPEDTGPADRDLEGSAAEGTVRSGLGGTGYEIDLTAGQAQALRDALSRSVQAARRARGRCAAAGVDSTKVRQWATAQGIEGKDRGRAPAKPAARFKAATGQ